MKKRFFIIVAIIIIILTSGCSVMSSGNGKAQNDTLKSLGLAYSAGEYTLKDIDCYGWITNELTDVHLSIPVGKKLLEGQKITVNSIDEVAIRTVEGPYLVGLKVDLTEYVYAAYSSNDGAILHVVLRDAGQWKGTDGRKITNNTPMAGYLNISFTITEP